MDSAAPAGGSPGARLVAPELVSYTHWMYALHALSAVLGLSSSAMIATAFVFGLPSIIAVIMNYVKRAESRGTWLESHFDWQLRTFWFALAWVLLVGFFSAPLLLLLGFGVLTWILGITLVGFWVIYRVARGWLRLKDGKPVS